MIICSQEDFDSILGIPRPNCSSKSWYIKELGVLKPPFTMGYWNVLDPDRKMFSTEDLLNQTQEQNPLLTYIPIELLNNRPHLYIIKINNTHFFELNRELGFSVIHKKVIQDVNNKKSAIIFINSWEGYSGGVNNNDLEILNQWCLDYTFNKEDVYYIQANLLIEKYVTENNYSFTGVGFSDFEGWLTNSAFEKEFLNLKKTRVYKKLFLSYNKRTRHHRDWLIAGLYANNLLEKGFISFSGFYRPNDDYLTDFLNEDQLVELQSKFPLSIDGNSRKENPAMEVTLQNYTDTFVSVVSETLTDQGILFLSEKTWKPILVGHPFIVYGCKGTLKYLKDRGYKTFSNWWDESYDNEEDPLVRLEKILEVLNKLKNKSIKELQQLNFEMVPVLRHNRELFLKDLKNNFNFPDGTYNKFLTNYLNNIYKNLNGY